MAFSPDGQSLATSYWGPEVKLWDVSSGEKTEKLVRIPLLVLANRESRVFFVSLSEATGATLSWQPPVPVLIVGRALIPGKITPLRTPNEDIALIFDEPYFQFESSAALVEVIRLAHLIALHW